MNLRLGTLGLIAAIVLCLPAHAHDEAPVEETPEAAPNVAKARLGRSLYFSAMGNYLRAAESRGTKDGFGGQVALGKSVTNGLNLELISQYLVARPDDGGGSSAKLAGVGIGAMIFPTSYLADLYVPISVMRGQIRDNPGPIPDYSTTFFDIGLGYLIPLTAAGTSIRAEVRYRIDAHGRELAGVHTGERKAFYEGVAGLGFIIPLGSKPAPVEPEPVEEPPAEVVPVAVGDADNDGVPDDKDQCPETPAGAVVDENGCPPPEPAPEVTCTPPGPGEPIDLNGCKAGDAMVLHGVNFALDSSKLMLNAKTILNGVSDALLAQQGIKAEIGGYTSSEGSDAHNQKLSEDRAKSVMDYLVSRGIAADRLTSKGYGEASPVADNATEEGREQNRRVELKVTESAPPPAPAEAPAAEPAATEPPAEGEAPVDGAAATDAAPADAPVEEAPPADAPVEEAPAETPAEPAAEAAPAEGEPAPEVQNAQPAQ